MPDVINLTPEQLACARAICLIKRLLEPKCDECGYGANRPNCAISLGGCPRHDQENVIAFHLVIRKLSGLNELPLWWQKVPLDQLHEFSDEERNLLDLYDRGGTQTTRARDDRWNARGWDLVRS